MVTNFRNEVLASTTESFTSLVDDAGNRTAVMDRATAELLASTLPAPTQSALDEVIAQTERVRVLRGGCTDVPLGTELMSNLLPWLRDHVVKREA